MDITKLEAYDARALNKPIGENETAQGIIKAAAEDSAYKIATLTEELTHLEETENAAARHGDRRAVEKCREKRRELITRREILAGENRRDSATLAQLTEEHRTLAAARDRAVARAEDAATAAYFGKLAVEFDALADRLAGEYSAIRTTPGHNGDFFDLIARLKNFTSNHAPKTKPVAPKSDLIRGRFLSNFVGGFGLPVTTAYSKSEEAAFEPETFAWLRACKDDQGESIIEPCDPADESRIPDLPDAPRSLRVGLEGVLDYGFRAVKSVADIFKAEDAE